MNSTQVVECVPNFSEGRRREVLEEIVQSVRDFDEVKVLDYEMDADHNRALNSEKPLHWLSPQSSFLARHTSNLRCCW